jgi:Ca2+-binding RTX toxin-like protein
MIGGPGLDTLTGGSGADLFLFTSPGTPAAPTPDTVTDFSHALDLLCFSDAAFNLGVDEGLGKAAGQPIAASLFSTATNGTFATAANRFAYNTSTGGLYYDADGTNSASASQLVATLTNHAIVTASDLSFVA